MGKPFQSELALLPETYSWALHYPIETLIASIRRSRLPLIAIGSGGSFSAAHLAANLHNSQYGLPAIPTTPLESVRSDVDLRDSAVLLLTAGGKNPDILGAFDHLVGREPRQLTVLCASTQSKLARATQYYSAVNFVDFDTPAGRDGFLATNSLLATGIVLTRAYAAVAPQSLQIPSTFELLCGPSFNTIDFSKLVNRPTLLVLYTPALKPVAVEIESKFIEAALGNVQIADFRQFAHGRHHWLAKRGGESAVLALCTESDFIDDTVRLLPESVPTQVLRLPHASPIACLTGIAYAFELARQAGMARRIDPGDPGVPAFGRKLYNLNIFSRSRRTRKRTLTNPPVAIERKTRSIVLQSSRDWLKAYSAFVKRLTDSRVSAIVSDYDGTLCDEARRFDPLPSEIAEELIRLLSLGLPIGVATGRGRSVREELRRALPQDLWDRVVVGYYNGSDIGLLSQDCCPDGTESVRESLVPVAELLKGLRPLLMLDTVELRKNQITLKSESISVEQLWQRIQGLIAPHLFPGVTVLRSGHSVDILAPGVSKLAVVEYVRQVAACKESEVLCLGDQGCWPGNDHALLGMPLSLSSNAVSADPERCWNLAPVGFRESQATCIYLGHLKRVHGIVKFKIPSIAW